MITSTAMLIPIALLWEGIPTAMPSTRSIIAMIILTVFCTAIAYILYYRLIDTIGATKVSMVSYLVAPFGVIYGFVFLQEPISSNSVVGLVIIIVGILIAGGTWRAIIKRPTPTA
jgi:drug/metabolite transporter (DMT)-like permease